MKKTIKILSILIAVIVVLSIGSTCFARMTKEEPEVESSKLVAEKEDASTTVVENKIESINSSIYLIVAITIVVIVIAIIATMVIIKKRKIK